ncbi:hypothetical protein GGQ87_001065 [Brevundimonas alba]|uniref:Uncharacterized protein n=1 Tax=Brevundimonas alba TaxID=74314 RepID=A0A7X6BMV9_9CAUL|nr:hypothetical protein [Brevundimonas alba]NJC40807.1 hypothetical protein [Brevundimonas alba]
MARSGSANVEQRLAVLRERQAELAAAVPVEDARLRSVGDDIVATARSLGFDPEEAAAIAAGIDAPATGPGHTMAGQYRVLRGAAEPILTFSALVVAGAVTGLGQPLAGAAVVLAAVASWVIRGARRIARIDIDSSGALSFPGRHGRIDPAHLTAISFAYRYPPFIADHQKAASETVDLRLHLSGGVSIKLAHGPLWRLAPRREPVAWHRLERHLLAHARRAGLEIDHVGASWTARRV